MALHQYIGARYVPIFYKNSLDPTSTEWEPNVEYEPMTWVSMLNGDMYLSKKTVPANAGAPSSTPEYWMPAGQFNAYISLLDSRINTLESYGKVYTFEHFGAVGDGVTDDTDAVKDALTYGHDNGVAITSEGGEYYVTADLDVDNTILFNVRKIKTSGHKIYIHNRSTVHDVSFEGMNVVVTSEFCSVYNIAINNVSTLAALEFTSVNATVDDNLQHGNYFANILINNHLNNTSNVIGVKIGCPDLWLYGVEVINCMTGFQLNYHCKLIACTAWSSSILSSGVLDWNDTVAYDVRGTGSTLIACTSDSMATSIKFLGNLFEIYLSDFKFINNNVNYTNKTFKFTNYDGLYHGNATFILSGFAAAGNTIDLGYMGELDIQVIDGSFNDGTINGYGCVSNIANISVDRALWRSLQDFININLQVKWNSVADMPANNDTITLQPQVPCFNMAKLNGKTILANLILYDSVNFKTTSALATASCDGTKFTITPFLAPTADYDKIRAIVIDSNVSIY